MKIRPHGYHAHSVVASFEPAETFRVARGARTVEVHSVKIRIVGEELRADLRAAVSTRLVGTGRIVRKDGTAGLRSLSVDLTVDDLPQGAILDALLDALTGGCSKIGCES